MKVINEDSSSCNKGSLEVITFSDDILNAQNDQNGHEREESEFFRNGSILSGTNTYITSMSLGTCKNRDRYCVDGESIAHGGYSIGGYSVGCNNAHLSHFRTKYEFEVNDIECRSDQSLISDAGSSSIERISGDEDSHTGSFGQSSQITENIFQPTASNSVSEDLSYESSLCYDSDSKSTHSRLDETHMTSCYSETSLESSFKDVVTNNEATTEFEGTEYTLDKWSTVSQAGCSPLDAAILYSKFGNLAFTVAKKMYCNNASVTNLNCDKSKKEISVPPPSTTASRKSETQLSEEQNSLINTKSKDDSKITEPQNLQGMSCKSHDSTQMKTQVGGDLIDFSVERDISVPSSYKTTPRKSERKPRKGKNSRITEKIKDALNVSAPWNIKGMSSKSHYSTQSKKKLKADSTGLYSAIDSRDWGKAILSLEQNPIEARTWVTFKTSSSGFRLLKRREKIYFLPLHAACFSGAPLKLVSDLIKAYPDAVREKAIFGKFPLHMACETTANHRVISLLLTSWPESLHVRDFRGNTPAQIVARCEPSEERENNFNVLVASY